MRPRVAQKRYKRFIRAIARAFAEHALAAQAMRCLGDLKKCTAKVLRYALFKGSDAERPSSSSTVRSENHDWIRGAPANAPTSHWPVDARAAEASASAPGGTSMDAALLHHPRALVCMHHMLALTSSVCAPADHAVFIGASNLDEAAAWHADRHRVRPARPAGGSGRCRLRRGGAPLVPPRGAPGGAPAQVGALQRQRRPPTAAPAANRLGRQPPSATGGDGTERSDGGGV